MAELLARLQALRPIAEKIRTISGATGISVGIIHEASVALTENYGFRDVKNKIAPDQDTIYYLASLSKSFTAAGVAHLVHESSALDWNTPVSEAYAPLSHENPDIRRNVTILDLLSHRSGLAPKNHIWSQEYGHFTFKRGEDIRTFTYLEKIAELRSKWIYNNWGYGVADELIEHLSGASWGHFLQDRIFSPLQMPRTVTMKQKDDDNVAKGYITLSSGEPWEVEEPDGEDGEILSGALSVKSCVRDLLQYYIAFMQAVKLDEAGTTSTTRAFVDAAMMVRPYITLDSKSPDLAGSYGLGWVTTELPCTLGALGMNHGYLGRMPTVGRGIPNKTTCYYHQGSANSFLCSVYLLPESQSGVIVLTNSMAQNDIADWIGELYLETLLNSPVKNDYISLAEKSAKAALHLWPEMRRELKEQQVPNTSIRPLSQYTGTFYNRIGNYRINIIEQNDRLLMRFQSELNIAYKLTHYHYDTFSWLISHDRDAKVGRFPITRASFYLIKFDSFADSSQVDSLIWIHDDEVLEGERFYKRDTHAAGELQTPAPDPLSRVPTPVNTAVPEVERLQEVLDNTTGASRDDVDEIPQIAIVATELEERTDGILEGERPPKDTKI